MAVSSEHVHRMCRCETPLEAAIARLGGRHPLRAARGVRGDPPIAARPRCT